MPSSKHPGPIIRRARRASEMKAVDLAAAIGRNSVYICRFEFGHINVPPKELAAMRAAIAAHRRMLARKQA